LAALAAVSQAFSFRMLPPRLCAALIAWLWLVAPSGAFGGPPRSNIWITYAPNGVLSTTTPKGDGSEIVSVGGLRPSIFSLRLRSTGNDESVEAELATPGGFDFAHIRAADISEEDWSGDASSDAGLRERKLERALIHHRPVVRLRLDRKGEPNVRRSPALRRHEACARRLLRAAIEAQIAAAENEYQRRRQQKRLEKDYLASVAPPVEQASLLLRLARLSLPSFAGAYDQGLESDYRRLEAASAQNGWRARQIRAHGRPVRLRLDLLSAGSSPAASLCRSLAYSEISEPRSDTCTIEGVIDRRDGWPLTLTLSRKGETASGATENQSRRFDRLAPFQGFVSPANPCSEE
jgi:hypothetical protein